MKNTQPIDIEKALDEKRTMQKNFIREHDRPSSVLSLVVAHFEWMKKRK